MTIWASYLINIAELETLRKLSSTFDELENRRLPKAPIMAQPPSSELR